MDSLTQIVLGAAVGEAAIGKKVGNKAILWGAIGGTIPDLDVIGRSFLHPVDAMHFHRGMTHSIVFDLVMAPILGWLVYQIHKRKGEASWWDWTWLMFLALFTHPLLDCFTTWGTQLLWPFTDKAIAWQTIFVVDPLYTVPFLVFVIWAMFKKRTDPMRWRLNTIGLVVSSLYLAFTVVNKQRANSVFEASMAEQNIEYSRYSTRPAPLQNFLWSVNAETDSGYVTGYHSFFDEDNHVNFLEYRKHHKLLEPWADHDKTQLLLHITQDWYTVRPRGDSLVVNDLRFGTMTGWTRSEDFVFSTLMWEENGELKFRQQQSRDVPEGFLKLFFGRVRGQRPEPAALDPDTWEPAP